MAERERLPHVGLLRRRTRVRDQLHEAISAQHLDIADSEAGAKPGVLGEAAQLRPRLAAAPAARASALRQRWTAVVTVHFAPGLRLWTK